MQRTRPWLLVEEDLCERTTAHRGLGEASPRRAWLGSKLCSSVLGKLALGRRELRLQAIAGGYTADSEPWAAGPGCPAVPLRLSGSFYPRFRVAWWLPLVCASGPGPRRIHQLRPLRVEIRRLQARPGAAGPRGRWRIAQGAGGRRRRDSESDAALPAPALSGSPAGKSESNWPRRGDSDQCGGRATAAPLADGALGKPGRAAATGRATASSAMESPLSGDRAGVAGTWRRSLSLPLAE